MILAQIRDLNTRLDGLEKLLRDSGTVTPAGSEPLLEKHPGLRSSPP